jgi:hypothetical protein
LKALFAMLADPTRCEPLFWVQETVTDWAPTPLGGLTEIQEPFPLAFQLPPVQPAGDPVRLTIVCPVAPDGFAEVDESENDVQVGALAAAWVTEKPFPATSADPERCEPVFCVQETVTVWAPTPVVGFTEIHAFPLALQLPPVQPAGDPAKLTVVCPLKAVGDTEVGQIEKNVQVAADCVTVKEPLAMVADPKRCDPVFWVQETVTVWGPTPLVGLTVIQEPFPLALQLPPVQPAGDPVRVTAVCPLEADGFAEPDESENDVQVGVP